jgi:hypothetical protein
MTPFLTSCFFEAEGQPDRTVAFVEASARAVAAVEVCNRMIGGIHRRFEAAT